MNDNLHVTGGSGAIIEIRYKEVVKLGQDVTVIKRLHKQCNYMKDINKLHTKQKIMPKITGMHVTGYSMQKGEKPDLWLFSIPLLMQLMKHQLTTNVWAYDPIIKSKAGWGNKLHDYIENVLKDHDLSQEMKDYILFQIKTLELTEAKTCAIHGDCTLDNVLLPGKYIDKKNIKGHIWISDPLPPDERIPSLRVVDLGKLLQSAIGWENLKYNALPPIDVNECIYQVMIYENQSVQRLAWLWCVIHLIRIIPYTTDERMQHALTMSITNVINLIRNTYENRGFKH
jgi:hypothetical protein